VAISGAPFDAADGRVDDDQVLDETRLRLDAIHYVRARRDRWVAVPASELRFIEVGGRRVFLKGQQGIFKPAEMQFPLSITSTLGSPYTDHPQGSRVLYDFAPRSREHENDGLKKCAEAELPLIYFLQVKRKPNPEYVVFAPVFVVGWDDRNRRFLIDLSEHRPNEVVAPTPVVKQLDLPALASPGSAMEIRELTKNYTVTTVQRRLHQARFRNEVLQAYRERCAVCVLRLRPLLDAAHVTPDRDPAPVILVNDGIALCATHHRAFDTNILRYDKSYTIRIELPERAAHGEGEDRMLVAFDGRPLTLPEDKRRWPTLME
jgi:putative restriction endonuclease